MLFTKTKSLIKTDFFKYFKDVHSHILYGVDDGVSELQESLDTLAYFQDLGIKEVVLTPHINISCNNWDLVNNHFSALCQAYKGDIKLNLAAEYMIDSGFEQQLKLGLKPLKDDRVLVESSYLRESANFSESLYNVLNNGYQPVIAHPERYLFMDYSNYRRLKDRDYMLQLNLTSLSGCYGKDVKARAFQLLKEGMYDMIGTDLHQLGSFKQVMHKIKLTKRQEAQLMDLVKKY